MYSSGWPANLNRGVYYWRNLIWRFFPRLPNRQNKNPAKFSRYTILVSIHYLNGSTSDIQVMTFPCTKPSLHVTLHVYVHGMYVCVTVLCVFKFHHLLCYFNQEVIVAFASWMRSRRLIPRLRSNWLLDVATLTNPPFWAVKQAPNLSAGLKRNVWTGLELDLFCDPEALSANQGVWG